MANACSNAPRRGRLLSASAVQTRRSHPPSSSGAPARRMRTVCWKVTQGLRSDWSRDLCGAGRAVGKTGNRQGLSAYQAMQKALSPVRSLFEPG